ncbi:unnamed protein product, partial [Closterium sp. Naga37s-1]
DSPADQVLMATPPTQLIKLAVDKRMLFLVKGVLVAVIVTAAIRFIFLPLGQFILDTIFHVANLPYVFGSLQMNHPRMLSLSAAPHPFQCNDVANYFEGSVVPHIDTFLPPKATKMTTGLFCDLVCKVYMALASLVPLLWWIGVSPGYVKQWIGQQCLASRASFSTLGSAVTFFMKARISPICHTA